MVQHCETLGRSVQVVNLDPAAEHFDYPVMAGDRLKTDYSVSAKIIQNIKAYLLKTWPADVVDLVF